MTDIETVKKLFSRWNRGVCSGDPDEVMRCYAEDAVLLPTLSGKIRHNHEEIRDYFEHFLRGGPEGRIVEENVRIFGDIAVNSGLYDFRMREQGKEISARFTFVYRKYGKEWLIIEHHSSLIPD